MTDDTPKPGGGATAPPREAAEAVAPGIGAAATDESEASAGSKPSTMAAVWQEGTPGHWVVKWGGLRGAPQEQAITLGRPDANNHSPSASADTTTAGRASGISVVWIESPAGDASGVGAIMLQRLGASAIRGLVDPAALAATANDNATWVSDQSGTGAVGREPRVAELGTGDTLVAWIGVDDHVHARLYEPVDARGASPVDGPEYASVNAALDDLGPVGAAADGSRQLRVAELHPGTFAIMWLALAEGIPVLRGGLFLSSADTEQNDHRDGWTHQPIPEARLPVGFADPFTMSLAGEGEGADLQVTHSGPAGAITLNVLGHFGADILGESHGAESSPLVGLIPVDGSGKSAAADAAPEQEAATGLDAPSDQSQTPIWQSEDDGRPAQIVLAVATTPGESAPLVQTVGDGFAVAWQTPGSTDGAVQIRLALFDESGVPKSPEVLVTDNAAADLAPAISSLSAGVAAAYVQADDHTLVIKAYTEDGAQIGQETVVNPGDTHAIVEIALGSSGEGELAVVYVQQDFDDGQGATDYGNIMLQRYAVAGEGDQSRLVELGRDGEQDGSDGAAQLTIEGDDPATVERVVGRAPSVTRVDDGKLAIVWGKATVRERRSRAPSSIMAAGRRCGSTSRA